MKRLIALALFFFFAAAGLQAAYEVKSEAELNSALNAGRTDILLTAGFTTTGNITIPAGCTVTLGDGVTLSLYYKAGGKNTSAVSHSLNGEGTIVQGVKSVKTTQTRTLPTIGGANNPFSGMTYDVTEVVETGGSLSYTDASQINCNVTSGVSVDGGKTVNSVNGEVKAVVCKVSSGINGGRTFVNAYSSMEDAYNAAKYTSYNIDVLPPDGEIVVLLADGEVNLPNNNPNIGIVVDCAGFTGSFPKPLLQTVQFNSSASVTFLNAASARVPQLTQSSASFINCKSATVAAVNANQDTYNSQVHVYDCGTVSLGSKYPAAGGAYFHCGGPYSMSFGTNYKVYGGIFANDPSSYLASPDLEAVAGSDGNWVVQEKTKIVNVAFIGSEGYESLQDAVDAANEGDKIDLVSDVVLSTPVVVAAGKSITVELAGMDIASEKGAFINNGSLKLEDSSNYDEPSKLTASAGNLIENNGSLEITYGDYSGNISLNAGMFTVHGGTFNGAVVAGDGVVDPQSLADIRGGQFKNSVASFLAEGYIEPVGTDGYYYVGKFPYSIVAEKEISGAEKGWTLKGLSDEDRAIYSKESNLRADYSDSEWYRRAELISMLTPYAGYTIDCVASFDRATAKDSMRIYLQGPMSINEELDVDLQSNEIYRILSSKIQEGYSQISYARFLTESTYESISVGIENLSDDNDGTACTIEFHLCRPSPQNKNELETVYVLASVSYRFPVPYVAQIGEVKYTTLQAAVDAARTGETVTVLDDIDLTETVRIDADDILTLDLNGKTVSMVYAEDATANHEMLRNLGGLTIQDSAGGGKLSYTYTGASLGTAYAANAVTSEPGSVLTVKSGTIENLTYDSAVIAYAIDGRTNGGAGDVTINIEGGTITSRRQSIRIFANSTTDTGALNISGGEITGRVIVQNASANANKAALNITGGSFNANAYKADVLYVGGSQSATIDIDAAVMGGTFNGTITETEVAGFISGGTFSGAVNEDYCADGYVPVDAGGGSFSVIAKPSIKMVGGKPRLGVKGKRFPNVTLKMATKLVNPDWVTVTYEVDDDDADDYFWVKPTLNDENNGTGYRFFKLVY